MSQTDLNVANGTGAAVRGDINDHLAALATLSGGATAPSTTFANQWWADEAANILKRRNEANTAWISIMDLTTGLIIGTDVQAYSASNADYSEDQSWDADNYQRLDGTADIGSLDALGANTHTINLGKVEEIDADVDGTIAAPTVGYGIGILYIYNNGTRSLTLSGFPTDALNAGTLAGTDTKVDILVVSRTSVNGGDIIDHWIYNRT